MPAGQPMMIPLASALYVAAELAVPDKVLVDIGTGYFSEVSCATWLPHLLAAWACCHQAASGSGLPSNMEEGGKGDGLWEGLAGL